MTLDHKTVLYGQTPNAVRLKQFQEMAKFNGMSPVEFAKHIAACSTYDNLMLLRQFHTSCQPQLSPLFESLEQCLRGDSKSCKTGHPCSLKKEQPTRNTSDALQNDSTVESIMGTKMLLENNDDLYELCNISESESFSHLGTGYSENNTLPMCGSLPCKTVISETESDSDSIEAANFTHKRDHKPLDSSSIVPVNFEEISVESPSLSTVASNVFDTIIRRGTSPTGITDDHGRVHEKDNSSIEASVSCSVNGVNVVENPSRSKEFNVFLDNLLFGDSPKKNDTKTSQNSATRREVNKVLPQMQDDGIPGYSKQSKSITKSSSLRNLREKKCTSVHEQCSGSYNKVLDQLLFGCASNNDQSVDVSESVDYFLPSTSRQPGKVSAILDDSLMKDNCEVTGKLNGTTDTNGQKADVSLKAKEKPLMNDEVENKILPTSLELQLSLWDSLDQS